MNPPREVAGLEIDLRNALAGLARGLDQLDTYKVGTFGRRDAKHLIVVALQRVIDAKIALSRITEGSR